MKVENLIIGLLVIGAVSLGLISFLNKLAEPANFNNELVIASQKDYETFNRIDSINKDLNQTKTGLEQILGKDDESSQNNYPNYQVGLWQRTKQILFGTGNVVSGSVSTIGGGITLVLGIIPDMANDILGFPAWLTNTLIGIITILVIIILFKFAGIGGDP